MRNFFVATACLFLSIAACIAAEVNMASPNGNLKAKYTPQDGGACISSTFNGKDMGKVFISLDSSPQIFNPSEEPQKVATEKNNDKIRTVWGINSEIEDSYNQTRIDFKHCALIVRLYDNALAYRFETKIPSEIKDEKADFSFEEGSQAYAYPINGYVLHFQKTWIDAPISELSGKFTYISPLLITPKGSGAKVLLTDADVSNYPGLNFKAKPGSSTLSASFAKYPKDLKPKGNALTPSSREDYLAQKKANEQFPWRVMIFAAQDKDLLCDDTIYKLSKPCALEDTSWIKPGLAAWDWWSGFKLEDEKYKGGMNTSTYFYYSDFATRFRIPYIIIDAGWQNDHDDVLNSSTNIDLQSIADRAKKGRVGVFVWVRSRALADMDTAKAFFHRLSLAGISGVKVDFVERDDAQAMDFYKNITALAAVNKLLIVWHGCPKSTGMYRQFPNMVNEEGVRGNELNKMKPDLTPTHNVNLLFTRSVCGPMDYTPGAMRNTFDGEINGKPFTVNKEWPSAQGTRAHQAAMYVMYYEPLKTLCDSATSYEKEKEYTKFISEIPTVWDESVGIDAQFGEFASVARRHGKIWYAAGMAAAKGKKDFTLNTDFLQKGASYEAEILSDTQATSSDPQKYSLKKQKIKGGQPLKIDMERGGGFVVRFKKS